MREFSLPALYEVPADGNLTDIVRRNAAQHPDVAVIARKSGGVWQDVTARDFLAEVHAAAKGLIASGIQPGDRVGLMSRTRYEWTLLDFAIWSAGAITVPVYETSSPEQVQWILSDSGATACVVELDNHAAAVESVRETLPALKNVWQIEAGGIEELGRAGQGISDAWSRSAARWRRRTTRRPSSTPPAPPAGPRAACSPTARSSRSAATSWSGCARCSAPASARCCSSCRWRTSSGVWCRWRR